MSRTALKYGLALAGVFGLGFGIGQVSTNRAIVAANPGQLTAVATTFADAFERGKASARSAGQVSQLADETLVPLTYMTVKQNDEIIRLLRKLAGER